MHGRGPCYQRVRQNGGAGPGRGTRPAGNAHRPDQHAERRSCQRRACPVYGRRLRRARHRAAQRQPGGGRMQRQHAQPHCRARGRPRRGIPRHRGGRARFRPGLRRRGHGHDLPRPQGRHRLGQPPPHGGRAHVYGRRAGAVQPRLSGRAQHPWPPPRRGHRRAAAGRRQNRRCGQLYSGARHRSAAFQPPAGPRRAALRRRACARGQLLGPRQRRYRHRFHDRPRAVCGRGRS